jgi:hypothetical protein
MVRRRATMYCRFFTDLRDALVSGELEAPPPFVAVVADEPGKLAPGTAQRLLMPLPTNPEQERVALRLAEHRGVTVQGPPGHRQDAHHRHLSVAVLGSSSASLG